MSMGKERAARMLQPTTAETLPDGAIVVKRCQVLDDWTRVRTEVIVIREGYERTFTLRRDRSIPARSCGTGSSPSDSVTSSSTGT